MYQYQDFTKYFDPQNMNKLFDFSQYMTTNQQQIETCKKIGNIWADSMTKYSQKQVQLMQTAMQDTAEAMRDMSSAKGIEDLMNKQAEWSRKSAEKYQSSAQDLAQVMQKTQTQCTDLIAQMVQQSWKQTTKTASSN